VQAASWFLFDPLATTLLHRLSRRDAQGSCRNEDEASTGLLNKFELFGILLICRHFRFGKCFFVV
jgi:hypothetical protein